MPIDKVCQVDCSKDKGILEGIYARACSAALRDAGDRRNHLSQGTLTLLSALLITRGAVQRLDTSEGISSSFWKKEKLILIHPTMGDTAGPAQAKISVARAASGI